MLKLALSSKERHFGSPSQAHSAQAWVVYDKSPLFDQSPQHEVQFARMNASHNTDSNQGSLSVNENTLEVSLIDVESLVKNEGPEKVSGMMKTNEIFVLNINKQNNKASVNFFSGAEPPIKNPKLISKIKVSSDSEHTKPTSPYSPNLKSPRVQEEQAHYKVHSDEKNAHEQIHEETSSDYAVDIPATHSYSKEEEEVLLNSVQQIAAKNGVVPSSAEEDSSMPDSEENVDVPVLIEDFIDDDTSELLGENDHLNKDNLIDKKTPNPLEEKTLPATLSVEKTPNPLIINKIKENVLKTDMQLIGATTLAKVVADLSQSQDPLQNIHYFDDDVNPILKSARDILHDFEKVAELAREHRFAFVKEIDGKIEVKVAEKWRDKFSDQINIEDKNGEVKVHRNDGIEPAFVIKTLSHEEMVVIAATVHSVALRLFDERNIELENKKEESTTKTQTSSSTKPDTPQQANLKRPLPPHIEHSHRKEKKLSINKASQATLRLLQEAAILAKHRHEDKERKELEEAIKLHQWIVLKEVLDFDLKQENIKEDSLKKSLIKHPN